jgi:flavin reductase (DIM6/NTAB) family NADH-FMN oxidoreductase RutF
VSYPPAIGEAGGVVEREDFKQVLGSVPAPVTVVTALRDGRPHGTTVSAFCSLSLEPPLVIVSLDRASELLEILSETMRFGVNVLQARQADHALCFARKGSEKFRGVAWSADRGVPRLPDSAAWIVCRAAKLLPEGDHVIVTGLVEHAERADSPPLVYRQRAFATLAPHPGHQ